MPDGQERLLECFRVVFPEATREQLLSARAGALPGWDSIATATLVSVVEQEFGIEVPLESLSGLDSFDAFALCVASGGAEPSS
jgi:acyl carrier protein